MPALVKLAATLLASSAYISSSSASRVGVGGSLSSRYVGELPEYVGVGGNGSSCLSSAMYVGELPSRSTDVALPADDKRVSCGVEGASASSVGEYGGVPGCLPVPVGVGGAPQPRRVGVLGCPSGVPGGAVRRVADAGLGAEIGLSSTGEYWLAVASAGKLFLFLAGGWLLRPFRRSPGCSACAPTSTMGGEGYSMGGGECATAACAPLTGGTSVGGGGSSDGGNSVGSVAVGTGTSSSSSRARRASNNNSVGSAVGGGSDEGTSVGGCSVKGASVVGGTSVGKVVPVVVGGASVGASDSTPGGPSNCWSSANGDAGEVGSAGGSKG